jgi:hypothetical protein
MQREVTELVLSVGEHPFKVVLPSCFYRCFKNTDFT